MGSGAAGPPPGNPSGSIVSFGRYQGWTLGEIARTDLEYLEWLDRMPIGRPYQAEIDELPRNARRRVTAAQSEGRGPRLCRRPCPLAVPHPHRSATSRGLQGHRRRLHQHR